MTRNKTFALICAMFAMVLLTNSTARADLYSDLGAIHNTGLAPNWTDGVVTGGNENTGRMLTPHGGPAYDYSIPALSPATAGNTRDFEWIHETSATNSPSVGTKWSFGVSGTQAILLASIDHTPVPSEGLEATLWGSSDSGATWTKGTLVEVYDMGWDALSIEDQPASRWTFPSAINLISLTQGLVQGNYSYVDGDAEIDAVQIIPAPGAFVLGAMGIGLVGWVRRRYS